MQKNKVIKVITMQKNKVIKVITYIVQSSVV